MYNYCTALLNRKLSIGLESVTAVHAAITNSTSKTISIQKLGNVMDINVAVKLASAISAYQYLFTLPSRYIPSEQKQVRVGSMPSVTIMTNGKVQVQGDYAANAWISFGRSYIL